MGVTPINPTSARLRPPPASTGQMASFHTGAMRRRLGRSCGIWRPLILASFCDWPASKGEALAGAGADLCHPRVVLTRHLEKVCAILTSSRWRRHEVQGRRHPRTP
jgi:hypothetical protein